MITWFCVVSFFNQREREYPVDPAVDIGERPLSYSIPSSVDIIPGTLDRARVSHGWLQVYRGSRNGYQNSPVCYSNGLVRFGISYICIYNMSCKYIYSLFLVHAFIYKLYWYLWYIFVFFRVNVLNISIKRGKISANDQQGFKYYLILRGTSEKWMDSKLILNDNKKEFKAFIK